MGLEDILPVELRPEEAEGRGRWALDASRGAPKGDFCRQEGAQGEPAPHDARGTAIAAGARAAVATEAF